MKKIGETSGLTSEEVRASREKYGSNRLSAPPGRSFFSRLLESFGDPIIKILLIALVLNILFLFRGADWYESAGIALAVFLATFVGALSEYGSESAFEKLREDASRICCRVVRDQKTVEIPLDEIVTGDFVLLSAGERVPADGYMIQGRIKTDQSALNGESKECEKSPGDGFSDDLLSRHAVFRGSTVTSGSGAMIVAAVGNKTLYGGMAVEVGEETRESPLKVRLGQLAGTLSKIGYFAAAAVAFADLFHQIFIDSGGSIQAAVGILTSPGIILPHILHAATLAITVIVVAVPEGLPMMITVVLSSNMRRMLKDKVLVRKLVGIETSGSLNILFTDKTGTLTKGRLEVTGVVTGGGNELTLSQAKAKPEFWERLMLQCYFGSASRLSGGRAIGGNTTDRALLNFAAVASPRGVSVARRIDFDSAAKYSAVQLTGSESGWYVMGAAEIIAGGCVRYFDEGGTVKPLSKNRILSAVERHAARGERVLALSSMTSAPDISGLSGMTLTALVVIRDELRPEVRASIRKMDSAGVQVVMVTGDNKTTAVAIAGEAGLIHSENDVVLTSAELSAMTDREVKKLLPDLRVVARALPSDKSRLVRLSEDMGLVTGMTGDGINDAPALKKADVGFAMGSGTEIAKEAGDIVILDDNFASIVRAVLYGRTIFKSIRKFIIFQLTMNFCAVGVSIIAPFIGIESPVTVIQMLWINIIMDTLAGLAFAGEPPLEEYMREPPKRRDEPIINRYMCSQIGGVSVFTVALCLVFLKLPLFERVIFGGVSPVYYMTMFFCLFVFSGVFNAFSARTHRLNLLSHLRGNRMFSAIMALIVVVQIGIIYFGGTLFRTVPLSGGDIFLVILLSMTVIPADLFRKKLLRLKGRKGSL